LNGTERQEQILAAMRLSGSISVNELIEMLPASPATVRRDITALAANGKIRKDRGRIFLEGNPQVPAFELRGEMYGDEKKRIAQAAAALVRDGDTIIIDAGTTTQALANALRDRQRLCVITNSIPVAYIFNGTAVHVFFCGGMLEDMAVVDNDAIQFLAAHQVDKAFVSATGIRGTQGLTTTSLFQFAVKRQIIKSAQEVYALLVESKFHATGVNLFADFRELTGIVTSKPVTNPDLLERLEQEHVQIITTDR
jgi:DeoR/GlpR family transcriptional regulator of sugar metabolism